MFRLPTSHSAFQYTCDIIQPPEPEIESDLMQDESIVIKPKKK